MGEAADAMHEVAVAMPSATEPGAGLPTAAGSETAAPLPSEATAPPSASEPAETIVAATAKPEPFVTAKDEEPARTVPMETDLAAPELKAAPAEALPVSERLE